MAPLPLPALFVICHLSSVMFVNYSVVPNHQNHCSVFTVDLSVASRYRTEKPSKSPPPPPPRRSFPSAHGLTTNRTGDVIVTSKNMKVRCSLGLRSVVKQWKGLSH